MVLLIANATRMVQQVIIRHRTTVPQAMLLQFAASVGGVCSLALALVAFTPVGGQLLGAFVGPHVDLLAAVQPVVGWCVPVPMLVALQNAAQGLMIGAGKTGRVNQATWLGTALLLVVTWGLMRAGLAGATAAAIAMVAALSLEMIWLTGGVLGRREAPAT
jgi:O-antigen/teichoic acid export membrane protein